MGKPLTYAAVPDETSHQSPITNHQSPITNHQSPITNHQSPITNHQSPITNHQSPITNHFLNEFIICKCKSAFNCASESDVVTITSFVSPGIISNPLSLNVAFASLRLKHTFL